MTSKSQLVKPATQRAPGDITLLLSGLRNGERQVIDKLISMVYKDLRDVARSLLRRERLEHTLEPTDVIHQAYPRLFKAAARGLDNRAHFFGTAKRAMLQILIEHTRRRRAKKRLHQKVLLEEATVSLPEISIDIFEIRHALKIMQDMNPQWAEIVRLRIFEGFSAQETARTLRLATSTERREWARARRWLRQQLEAAGQGSLVGKTLLHYQVLAKIGEGAMTQVYSARDTHLDRLVALKILPEGLFINPEFKRRFLQEARCASALNHPNIVTVHDIAHDKGLDFIVMEHIEGCTLADVTPKGGLPLRTCFRYALQIASAISAAHAAGIIHRDLKPSNILVTAAGLIKLLDFGSAKSTVSNSASTGISRSVALHKTLPGTILGTVGYMSPEQVRGHAADARSDIFGFGAIFYEMLSGRRAFRGNSPIETMHAILKLSPRGVAACRTV